MAIPRRAISSSPRVINAALVLSPIAKPSMIPAAIAITFFNEPPISAPIVSPEV